MACQVSGHPEEAGPLLVACTTEPLGDPHLSAEIRAHLGPHIPRTHWPSVGRSSGLQGEAGPQGNYGGRGGSCPGTQCLWPLSAYCTVTPRCPAATPQGVVTRAVEACLQEGLLQLQGLRVSLHGRLRRGLCSGLRWVPERSRVCLPVALAVRASRGRSGVNL